MAQPLGPCQPDGADWRARLAMLLGTPGGFGDATADGPGGSRAARSRRTGAGALAGPDSTVVGVESRDAVRRAGLGALLLLLAVARGAAGQGATDPGGPLFEARSAAGPSSAMDIVVREIERRPRASVVEVEIRKVGSSVGASFFLLCSLRRLAAARGGADVIVKREDHPRPGQMLVGFLAAPDEPPAHADPAFAGPAARADVVALAPFAPICDAAR